MGTLPSVVLTLRCQDALPRTPSVRAAALRSRPAAFDLGQGARLDPEGGNGGAQ